MPVDRESSPTRQEPAAPSVAVEHPDATQPVAAGRGRRFLELFHRYAVLVMLVALAGTLSIASDAFLSPQNLLNILNQNAPLAIIASAGTLVIIGGGFDLSTGPMFGVAAVTAAFVAVNLDPILGLLAAPAVGLLLGILNGTIIATLGIHSFLATLATGLVYRGLSLLVTDGRFITVSGLESFLVLGRGELAGVDVGIWVMIVFALLAGFLLNWTTFGRYVYAVGGNTEAAMLSGVRTGVIQAATFAFSGLAAGLAGAIQVSRISSGQPQAGQLLELEAIAAIILGGTSIYGGEGAVWRSLAGVYLLALIDNGFNILNANPFFKDLTTGVVIVLAVALSAAGRRTR